MKVTEADAGLAITTAKILGVELEPWQEKVLQWLYADHRSPDSTSLLPALAGPRTTTQAMFPGECGQPSEPQRIDSSHYLRLRCRLAPEHTQPHEGLLPGERFPVRWT